jgi:hypothetical protein
MTPNSVYAVCSAERRHLFVFTSGCSYGGALNRQAIFFAIALLLMLAVQLCGSAFTIQQNEYQDAIESNGTKHLFTTHNQSRGIAA